MPLALQQEDFLVVNEIGTFNVLITDVELGRIGIPAVAVAVCINIVPDNILRHKILLSRMTSDTRNLPPSIFEETNNLLMRTFSTQDLYLCSPGSSKQQNFMSKHFLSSKMLWLETRKDFQKELTAILLFL